MEKLNLIYRINKLESENNTLKKSLLATMRILNRTMMLKKTEDRLEFEINEIEKILEKNNEK